MSDDDSRLQKRRVRGCSGQQITAGGTRNSDSSGCRRCMGRAHRRRGRVRDETPDRAACEPVCGGLSAAGGSSAASLKWYLAWRTCTLNIAQRRDYARKDEAATPPSEYEQTVPDDEKAGLSCLRAPSFGVLRPSCTAEKSVLSSRRHVGFSGS